MPLVNCDTCGKSVHKSSVQIEKNQRNYCSMKCRGNNAISKPPKTSYVICDGCGKSFYKKPNRVKRSQKQYCSFECRKKNFVKICEHCGKEFSPKARGQKGDAIRFCSRKCSAAITQGKRTIEIRVIANCHNCKKQFSIQPSRLSYVKRTFCSMKCKNDFHSLEMSGDGNPTWMGGHDGYRGPDWNRQRKKALKRDNYQCQVCFLGRDDHKKQFGEDLNVHHITPYRLTQDNSLPNLITLCVSHHILIEKGTLPCPLLN